MREQKVSFQMGLPLPPEVIVFTMLLGEPPGLGQQPKSICLAGVSMLERVQLLVRDASNTCHSVPREQMQTGSK